jgi:hypothetical protein
MGVLRRIGWRDKRRRKRLREDARRKVKSFENLSPVMYSGTHEIKENDDVCRMGERYLGFVCPGGEGLRRLDSLS